MRLPALRENRRCSRQQIWPQQALGGYKRMQGMLGGSTAKGTKVLAKLNGATEKLEKDSFDANQTLVVTAATTA